MSAMAGGFPGMFPPLWSNGERAGGLTDVLASYASIYATQPVVATAVDKLARRIATLPLDAYTKAADDRRQIDQTGSLATLLRAPMPRWSKVSLLHFVAQSLLVNGNALLAKVRSNDPDAPPGMLWPLYWSQVSAYAPQGGRIEWWSTTQFEGVERFLSVSDTLHFAWESPEGEIGVSPLQKLGVTLKIEDAAQRHQTAAFKNGARPGGVFTMPPGAAPTKEQMDLTRATIQQLYSGDNAFKTGIVAPGAKWEAMSMSPVEVELIEQRKLNREEIGMVYDLAGPLMNDLTHGTYSNVEELNKALYRDVVPPWTGLIEHTMQVQLIDPEPSWLDQFVAFDYADKLKGEPRELAETLKLEVEAGLITRNEARRILNLPPVADPEADELSVNANNQASLSQMNTPPPAEPPAVPDQ